jgi:hypothetical protein
MSIRRSTVGLSAGQAGLIALALATLACNTLMPPRPAVEWNPAADSLVVEASSAGGMLPDFNYVPAARLWGDGRLVWSTFNSNSGRSVQTRTLTTDEMRALLVRIENEGFFGWNDQYSPGVVYDAPITCLRVSLTSTSKSVCEMISGAPAGFDRLFAELGGGAGQAGTDFLPERGYLTVTRLQSGSDEQGTDWPAETMGLSLAEAQGGVWIEGPALALAWQAVNANSLYPLLREGDAVYQAKLLVPGVTLLEPSTP